MMRRGAVGGGVSSSDLLTAEQAQEWLGVGRATFWALVKRHAIPRYKVPVNGKRVFFKPADLEELRKPVPVGTGSRATG